MIKNCNRFNYFRQADCDFSHILCGNLSDDHRPGRGLSRARIWTCFRNFRLAPSGALPLGLAGSGASRGLGRNGTVN